MEPFYDDLELNRLTVQYLLHPNLSQINPKIRNSLLLDWEIFKSVFYHLISNAIKHSVPNSSITLDF
jgi:signal transduction histidine kinase